MEVKEMEPSKYTDQYNWIWDKVEVLQAVIKQKDLEIMGLKEENNKLKTEKEWMIENQG